jgi:predicted PurR-regulated permease PerM
MIIDRNRILWILSLLVFVSLLWLLSDVVLPFISAIALAYMQAPLADRLERLGMNRTMASLLIVSVVVLTLVLLIVVLAPILSEQGLALMAGIRSYADQIQVQLADSGPPWLKQITGDDPQNAVHGLVGQGASQLPGFLGSLWSGGKALISLVSVLVIMPVITFYLICDWHPMIETLDSWVPPRRRKTVHQLAGEIDAVVSGFLRGQAAICLISGIYYAAALALVGLNFAILIGLLAGVLSFIPFVGSLIAVLIGVGVAFQQFWPNWVPITIVAVIFMVGQFVAGYVLGPKLVGDRVGLHPVWLIFAMFLFGYLFGFLGLLVAVPLGAAVAVLFRFELARCFASPLYRGEEPG